MKIRTRLFLLLVTLALVPLVVLGAASYYLAMDSVRDKVSEQLDEVRGEIENATQANVAALDGLARSLEMDDNCNLYLTYYGQRDVAFLKDIMARIFEFHVHRDTRLIGIEAVLPGGERVAALQNGVTALPAAPAAGLAATAEGTVSLARPVVRGENRATIVVHARIEYFMAPVRSASIGVDKPVDGFLIAAGQLHAATPTARESLQGMNFGSDRLVTYGDRIAAVGAVAGTPFVVGASMPKEEFLAPVRRVRNITVAIILIVAVAASAAALAFATSIVKPVQEMAVVTHRFAGGDLDARLAVARTDELGQLSSDFNVMAGKLKRTIGDLDRSLRELTAIYEASSIIGKSEDLEEVLQLAAMLMESGLGVKRSAFLKADGGSFACVHVNGLEDVVRKIPSDLEPLRRAFDAREPLIVEEQEENRSLREILPEALARSASLVLVPLTAGGRNVGLVLAATDGAPDEELRRLFAVIGSLLAPIFATAVRSGAGLYEPLESGLQEIMNRMDRLDSRCSLVALSVAEAEDAGKIAAAIGSDSRCVHRIAPTIVVAVFPGLGIAEAEALATKRVAEVAPGTKPVLRSLCYPDQDLTASAMIAGVLKIER